MTNIDSSDEIAPPKPWGTIATVLWTLLTVFVSVIVLVPTHRPAR
jgi:hypothetical protein